jgi:UDP-2-acetamido-2-deoxy-ribo-hexuluronate aminotransferase
LSQQHEVQMPMVPEGMKSAWAQYSILAKDENHRTHLQAKLKESGIPTAIYYPTPLHLQTAFRFLGYEAGDFPVSEDFSGRIFSLPMHPYLSAADQERITTILCNQ